jgi:hypothetical protein
LFRGLKALSVAPRGLAYAEERVGAHATP